MKTQELKKGRGSLQSRSFCKSLQRQVRSERDYYCSTSTHHHMQQQCARQHGPTTSYNLKTRSFMTSPKKWLYHPHQPPHSVQDPVQPGQNSALTPMTPNGCLISLRIFYWHQHFHFPTSWKSLGFGSDLHLFWDMVLLQVCHSLDVKSRHLCGLFSLQLSIVIVWLKSVSVIGRLVCLNIFR